MSGDAHRDSDHRSKRGETDETLLPGPAKESWDGASDPSPRPSEQGIGFTIYGKTHVGLIRDHNEDNFMVGDLSVASGPLPGEQVFQGSVSDRGLALAVCDGMGGAAAGEVASRMAVDTLFEMLRGESEPTDRDGFARRLVDAIEDAGSRIFLSAKKD